MLFLSDLAANNDRAWLKSEQAQCVFVEIMTNSARIVHDPDYRTSLNDFNSFLERLQEKLITVDETIPELPVKDIVRKSIMLRDESRLTGPRYFGFIETSDLARIRLHIR